MQECEGQIQQEGLINWLHAKLEQRSALELNECHLTAGPEMAECLFKLCVKTYYITQAHINTFALAGGQVLGTHTRKCTQPSSSLAVQRQTERCMWSYRLANWTVCVYVCVYRGEHGPDRLKMMTV